jgi:hypothetical protein
MPAEKPTHLVVERAKNVCDRARTTANLAGSRGNQNAT